MKNERINIMMPEALNQALEYTEYDKKTIQNKYMAGISSFGASIISTGVKATLLFYQDKKGQFNKFEGSIVKILGISDVYNYDNTKHILDAVTALKLAMRTYEKVDNKGVGNE